MIDGGAIHNFIDASNVKKRGLKDGEHEAFLVRTANGTLSCATLVPQFSMALGSYTLINDFYVIDIEELNVVLGFQWLCTVSPRLTDFKPMQLSFTAHGKRVLLQGLCSDAPRVVSARRMERNLRYSEDE